MLKISVITASYNNCGTIQQTLDSVLSQTYPIVEYIVIDGGSTDGTLKILDLYKSKLDVYISEPDGGIYDALNKGILHSTGDIVGFLHADDLFESDDVLDKIANVFNVSKVEAVYGDLVYVRKNDTSKIVRYWKSCEFNEIFLHKGWMPPHPTLYIRRSVYKRLGTFDTSYLIAADYDLVLRFFGKGKLFSSHIPEVLVRMRHGGISNKSVKTIIKKSLEDLSILRRNQIGGILTLISKNLLKLAQLIPGQTKK
ncbi:glycosyltransferase [Polynucleobacter sp. MWH-UH19D]|uniref:glycosyltransferase family 2 protein n=1 Tax=Polynucleobacter sp. MWH-UH19D TaxID=1855610 RepID=UPI003364BC44